MKDLVLLVFGLTLVLLVNNAWGDFKEHRDLDFAIKMCQESDAKFVTEIKGIEFLCRMESK